MKTIIYFLSSFISAFAIAILVFPLVLLEFSCDNIELRNKVRILKQQQEAKQIEMIRKNDQNKNEENKDEQM